MIQAGQVTSLEFGVGASVFEPTPRTGMRCHSRGPNPVSPSPPDLQLFIWVLDCGENCSCVGAWQVRLRAFLPPTSFTLNPSWVSSRHSYLILPLLFLLMVCLQRKSLDGPHFTVSPPLFFCLSVAGT